MTFVWVVRSIFLFFLLPVVIPFRPFFRAFRWSALDLVLLLLALSLDALALTLAVILGVLGAFFDALIVLGLVMLFWKWPRGVRAHRLEQLRLAYRGAQNAACYQLRCATGVDIAFCVAVIAIAVVLSLSSGFLQFLMTTLIVLAIVGIVWKWPQSDHLPAGQKLRLAITHLWHELRRRFR